MKTIRTFFLFYFFLCRYCVLLITGEEEVFVPGNKAFLSLASANTEEVLRFAYVYQSQQQPLCAVLLKNRDTPPQVHAHCTKTKQLHKLKMFLRYGYVNYSQCYLPSTVPQYDRDHDYHDIYSYALSLTCSLAWQ